MLGSLPPVSSDGLENVATQSLGGCLLGVHVESTCFFSIFGSRKWRHVFEVVAANTREFYLKSQIR